MDNQKITIKNMYLGFIINELGKIKVDEKVACARRRFNKLLKPFVAKLEAEQKDLISTMCEKDHGQFKFENGDYVFKNAISREVFSGRWSALNDITSQVEVTEKNKPDVLAIGKMVSEEIVTYKKNHPDFVADEYDYLASLEEVLEQIKL